MFKRIVIYGLGTFFSKILVFLMVPIYTRVFSPADYGYYDVLLSDMQMLVSICFVEIWSGIIRFMFEDKDPYKPIKTFLSMLPVLMIIYSIAVWGLSFFIELKYPFAIVTYGISYLLFNVSNSICRGLNRNIEYVLSGIISTLVSCGLSIWGTVIMHKGINILFYSQIIGFFCAIGFIEYRTKAYSTAIGKRICLLDFKNIITYCFPLMLNSFSFLFLGTYNKNMVINKLGETASGYYAFSLKFSAIISILISVYTLAWQEEAFINANKNDKGKLYSFYINAFIRFVGLAIPGYIVLTYFVAPFVGGNEFLYASKYIPLAVLSAFLAELSGILSVIIAVNKKTVQTLLSTIIGATINVIVLILLINIIGVNASNIALCCGFAAAALCRYIFSKKMAELKLEWHWLILLGGEMVVLCIIYFKNNIKEVLICGISVWTVWLLFNYKFICITAINVSKKLRGRHKNCSILNHKK